MLRNVRGSAADRYTSLPATYLLSTEQEIGYNTHTLVHNKIRVQIWVACPPIQRARLCNHAKKSESRHEKVFLTRPRSRRITSIRVAFLTARAAQTDRCPQKPAELVNDPTLRTYVSASEKEQVRRSVGRRRLCQRCRLPYPLLSKSAVYCLFRSWFHCFVIVFVYF